MSKRIVVIMTDGVEDTLNSNGGQQFLPFVASHCDTLRKPVVQGGKGYEIFVLQAADVDSFISAAQNGPGDPKLNDDGSPWTKEETFNASVAALQACAGGDVTHYFLASQPNDIKTATDKIIALALSHPTVLALPTTASGP